MSRLRTKLTLAGGGAFLLCALPVVLLGGASNPPSLCVPDTAPAAVSSGSWKATAYGPPWGGIQGDGVTATGLNLSAGQPALEIAVDPTVIPLGSFEHITPNPFDTQQAFYAGDTGGAITGKHVDIYDWQGRGAQDAWGQRQVTVTAAPNPGAANLLDEITPNPTLAAGTSASTTATTASQSCGSVSTGPLPVVAGQAAQILSNGQAAAPNDAPRAVQLAIAAGNELIDKPYIWGGGHGQPLTQFAAGYDCSGSTSFLLHAGGLFGEYADTSPQFESWGEAGPGQWITVYATSGHVFIDIAGVVMNTAWYAPVTPTTPSSGPRWQPGSSIQAQIDGNDLVDSAGATGFVTRHPQGY